MATTISLETLRLFIEDRFRRFNPRENLDAGSPARVQVIDPIVRRFAPDPLEPDLKRFALVRLQQEFPALYAKEGSALADTLVKPMQVMLEPLRREIRGVKRNQSMIDPQTLAPAEADALLFNVFVRRRTGDFARLKIRIYFPNPMSVTVGSTNFGFTATGLRFIPRGPQSITSQAMLFNQDGDLFYFDVDYIAEAPGSRYNIGASRIIGVTGLTAATRATNLARAEYGGDEETTIEMIERGEKSIGERSLTTVPGAVAVLFEQFTDLQILQIIGFNDPEMQRDVITGGGRGPILYYGEDADSSDDGSAGAFTSWFDAASGSFDTRLGPVGTDISAYELTLLRPGEAPLEFILKEVLGSTRISISDDYTDSGRLPFPMPASSSWLLRQREELTLSGVPGGILFPDELATEVVINNNEVHVGGCADLHVKGNVLEDKSLAVPVVSDQNVIARRYDADFQAGSDIVTLNDATQAELDDIVVGRTSIWVKAGTGPASNLGVYRIIGRASNNIRIQTDAGTILAGTEYSYELVDDVDIDLTGPKEIKYEGDDLRTYAGSTTIDTASGLPNFTNIGVTDEDVVEIINGDDRGVYNIDVGGVAASQITLSIPLVQTDGPLQYRIYRLEDGITLPLLRVRRVEMLDSSLKPLGSYIPYRHPVDARSNSFQNPGRGAKFGTTLDADDFMSVTAGSDDVRAVDNLGVPDATVDFYTIGVRPGDIVNVNTGNNRGFHTISVVGGSAEGTTLGLATNQLRLAESLTWGDTQMSYEIGPPSYGSFRLYFLDAVTFEADYDDTFISVELAGGSTIRYRPDPDVNYEYLPTSVTVPGAVATDGVNSVTLTKLDGSDTIDGPTHGVSVGDKVVITYAPIVGSIDLATASLNLDGLTLLIDVGKGTETVSFTGTSLGIDTIVSQINSQLTSAVASKYVRTGAPAGTYLMLRADQEITLDGTGTATSAVFDQAVPPANGSRSVFMPWLGNPTAGEFAGQTTENDSEVQGTYRISGIIQNDEYSLIELDGSAWGGPSGYDIDSELGHYMHLSSYGVQRISSTAMASQVDDLGFYYFDLECISEGYGDTYNIGEDEKGVPEGYYSEGWSISVENENLSYSMVEVPLLDISPRILVEGVADDPNNATELIQTNVQVDYERMPLVQNVHTFTLNKQNRVVCESPLARALFPTFIRTSIQYRGGPTEADARTALTDVITNTIPEEDLETSDLHDEIRRLGSVKVTQPITVVGISHQKDRSIDVTRSQDAIATGRLSAMIPDDDGTTVEGASYIFLERVVS